MTDDEKAKRAEELRKAQEERQRSLMGYTYQNELARLVTYLEIRKAMQYRVNRALLDYNPDETE